LFFFVLLISLAFYEQITIVALTLGLLFGIRLKRKKIIYATLLCGAIVIGYYGHFLAYGPGGERAVVEASSFAEHLKVFWYELSIGWGIAHWELFSNGLARGMRLLSPTPEYLALAMIGGGFFAYVYTREKAIESTTAKHKIIWGFVLFLLPLTIFTLTGDHSYAFRNCFPSIIGLALVVDGAVSYIPKPDTWLPIASGVVVFMFLVVGISESSDYRAVSLADRAFVEGILPQTVQNYLMIDRIPSLVEEQNTRFAEHILSVTSSGWALTGAARHISGNIALPQILVIWGNESECR
jgi:hypothetical protein